MSKLILVKPEECYIPELISFKDEMSAADDEMHGCSALDEFPDDKISAWIQQCKDCEKAETKTKEEWVTAEQFLLVHENELRVLGMFNFRHELNDFLEKIGGHIGYCVRPSERRKGYAKEMLFLGLEKCREYGLKSVLITCTDSNIGSRKTIEACGGVFEGHTHIDDDEDARRYWVNL